MRCLVFCCGALCSILWFIVAGSLLWFLWCLVFLIVVPCCCVFVWCYCDFLVVYIVSCGFLVVLSLWFPWCVSLCAPCGSIVAHCVPHVVSGCVSIVMVFVWLSCGVLYSSRGLLLWCSWCDVRVGGSCGSPVVHYMMRFIVVLLCSL